ncbi:MAG: hypothetical protein HW399_277 [Dehalococcoidia bacterium]|nr:hypothetical protein [Dehalococcoidia bacterium]
MVTNARQKQRLNIPDIDIIPAEYKRPAISSLSLLLIILIIGSAFGLYKLLPLRIQANVERASLDSRLTAAQQEIKGLQGLEAQVKELKDSVEKLENRKKESVSAWEIFIKQQVKWRLLLDGIQGTIPQGVTIDSIIQKDSGVVVHGLAPNLNSVLTYANALRNLGLTQDLGVTYEIRPEGNISFNLNMVINPGGKL